MTDRGPPVVPLPVMPLCDIGEHHDVRDLAQAADRLHRARDRRLAMHFRIEKADQQFPDQRALQRLAAVLVTQSLCKAALAHVEMDIMAFVQPLPEGHHHMQQHLVAIGDDQWAVHAVRASFAAISAVGVLSMLSAQAIRSGS